ncbi:hypothetical protein BDP27DRAFT_314623 [Rhodocollybia butyracea]|uniref:Uncharacterized protein n=1 Tax=Rhodocollybia butyracea TaxID=206335 RepID=A0A9P5UCH1_9AGAR|nr:hypothetical protein BDP27DRAFT_314623 [Rhodocollybia butyracea]
MGSRRDSFNNKKNAKLRSTSKASTSSSSSASSGAEHSPSSASVPSSNKPRPSNIRRRRRSGGPNHVHLPRKGPPSLVRNGSSTALSSLSSSDKDKDMVSIAPIAPTMLKTGTGGGHTSWDGFGIHGVQSPYLNPAVGDWAEGFGDEGFSDDGGTMRFGPGGARLYFGHNSSDSEGGTPVGLVYMPPASSRYGSATLPRVSSKSSLNSEAEVELREDANQRDADNIELGDNMGSAKETAGMKKPYHHHEAYFSIESDKDGVLGTRSSVPIVVHTPAAELARGRLKADKDAYDYFGGPDLGEDFAQRKTKSSARRKTSAGDDAASFPVSIKDEGQTLAVDEERRSRSRSRSRTPSPSYSPQSQSSTSAITVPGRTEPAHSLPSSSSLLYPPQRGRGTVTPQDPPSSSRGRTSSLLPERSRSRSNHSSPIGSLSPEGIGSAYSANGRGGGDRERDRERSNRTSGRGRERTERRLTHSVSPEASESINSQVVGPDASVSSSSSGSRTIVPLPVTRSSERSSSPADILSDEDLTRSSHPTPSSSPVISMSGAAHAIARMNSEPPLSISDPQVLSPRLSYNVEPTNFLIPSHSPSTLSNDKASLQSPSSCRSAADDASVVGKAVGMVSSAGAYLGFWNNGTSQ